MLIKPILTYRFEQKDYVSLKSLKSQVESEIGKLLDDINPRLSPKDALNVHSAIIKHRERLTKLLNVKIDLDNFHEVPKNLFDIEV